MQDRLYPGTGERVRKICLVFLVNESFDPLTPFEQAFKAAGFEVESVRIPNVWISGLTRKYVNDLEALIRRKKTEGYFVVFSPQSTELFLTGPDLIIAYSAYRSWFDAKRMRVIPHLWTPVRPPTSVDRFKWTTKPPLRVGFMGRSYTTSRLANILMKAPMQVKQWLLSGNHLRYPRFLATLTELKAFTTFNAFPRIETLQILKARAKDRGGIETDIRDKIGFNGTAEEMQAYERHLEFCTYVVCPRGTENYSFRIYEALNRGRVPVIIDTDVVLPKEIDWDRLSVRVPYEQLDSIYDIIARDYHARSAEEFVARQELAFATMAELAAMRWMKSLAHEVGP